MAVIITSRAGHTHKYEIGASASIGRDPSCDIAIDDPRVSRKHAVVKRAPTGEYILSDLGSSYGSFVGGRKVASAALTDGVSVQIGDTTVSLELRPSMAVPGLSLGGFGSDSGSLRWIMIEQNPQFPRADQASDPSALARDYERLRATYELSRAIGVEQDLDQMLHRILDVAFYLLPADRGAIVLLGAMGAPSSTLARVRFGSKVDFQPSKTIIDRVVAAKSALIAGDTTQDIRFSRSASLCAAGVRSAMCVPMMYADEVIGVMHVDSTGATNVFRERDAELFTTIANQAALAIKNLMLREAIQRVTAEERMRLDRIIRTLPTGLLLLDEQRKLARLNPAAQALLGSITSAKKVGDSVTDICGLPLDELLLRCERGPIEVIVTGPPRGVFMISTAGSVGPEGASAELVFVIQDVTEVREQEERTAQAARLAMVGQLASGVAHDFNNLLCVALTAVGSLENLLGAGEHSEDLQCIRQASERGGALVKQLLGLSRRPVATKRICDPAATVEELRPMLERALGMRHKLVVDVSGAIPRVEADAGQIDQVLVNLVVNARDAMSEPGIVTIEATTVELSAPDPKRNLRAGRHARIAVRDTGSGMRPDVCARIFEPFFTTKEPGKGTGLGLATAYAIMRNTGGAITVDSAVGRGTTFELWFPEASEVSSTLENHRAA